MIKIGDQIVVSGILPPAKVSDVWYDYETARTVIELDWGERGTSKVFDYDENKIWYKYDKSN